MSAAFVVDSHASVLRPPERIGVKLVLRDPERFDRKAMIPVFHRWIQDAALDGLLIDVHDYTHVAGGPGVMLIAHEGHVRTDEAGGELGLEFERKRGATGDFHARVWDTLKRAVEAAVTLSEEPLPGGPARFFSDRLVFRFADRLAVPPTDAGAAEAGVALAALLSPVFDGGTAVTRVGGEGDPLTLRAQGLRDPGLQVLAERVGLAPRPRPVAAE